MLIFLEKDPKSLQKVHVKQFRINALYFQTDISILSIILKEIICYLSLIVPLHQNPASLKESAALEVE